jgi:hypothetical protein
MCQKSKISALGIDFITSVPSDSINALPAEDRNTIIKFINDSAQHVIEMKSKSKKVIVVSLNGEIIDYGDPQLFGKKRRRELKAEGCEIRAMHSKDFIQLPNQAIDKSKQ